MQSMSFWEKVEKELEYRGISRKELAFRANIAYQGIGLGIERNSMPRADTAVKISKVLNVPLEYLLEKKDIELKSECDGDIIEKKFENSNEDECLRLFYKNKELIENLEKIPSNIKEPVVGMILRLGKSF